MATAASDNSGDDFDTHDAVLEELNHIKAKHIAASIISRFDTVDTKCVTVSELIDGAQSKRTKEKTSSGIRLSYKHSYIRYNYRNNPQFVKADQEHLPHKTPSDIVHFSQRSRNPIVRSASRQRWDFVAHFAGEKLPNKLFQIHIWDSETSVEKQVKPLQITRQGNLPNFTASTGTLKNPGHKLVVCFLTYLFT